MFSTIGALVNIGIILYLAMLARSGMTPEQLGKMEVLDNPLIISFVGILSLFLCIKHK